MGAADAVPGVSGGTMALIMGIYEQLLTAISQGFHMILAAVRGNGSQAAEQFRSIQWSFILPLIGGIGAAIGIASVFVPDLLERYPTESRALFLGLVGASIAIPWNRIPNPGYPAVMTAFIFAVPAFFLSGLPSGTMRGPCAVDGVCRCSRGDLRDDPAGCERLVPPARSGTLRADPRSGAGISIWHTSRVFALGAIAGLGSFATLLRRLLSTNHDRTMAALVGLMIGSLRALWPWQDVDRSLLGPDDSALTVLVLVVIGFGIVSLIQRAGSRSRHPAARG